MNFKLHPNLHLHTPISIPLVLSSITFLSICFLFDSFFSYFSTFFLSSFCLTLFGDQNHYAYWCLVNWRLNISQTVHTPYMQVMSLNHSALLMAVFVCVSFFTFASHDETRSKAFSIKWFDLIFSLFLFFISSAYTLSVASYFNCVTFYLPLCSKRSPEWIEYSGFLNDWCSFFLNRSIQW